MRKVLLLLTIVIFCLIGCEESIIYREYIYTYTTWDGETDYHFSNLTPEEMAEQYDDRTLLRIYESENGIPEIAFERVGSMFLFKDPDWFLYDVETGEKTPVSLNEDPETTGTYVLLGETEPKAVAILHKESRLWGIFSIGADRMISDYEYSDVHHKEMVDGKIAVLTENGAYLLDPLTGELCGEADMALFEG